MAASSRNGWVVLGAAVLWLSACAHAPARPGAASPREIVSEAPVSSLRGPVFRYRFGVYTDQKPTLDVAQALQGAAAAHGFRVVPAPVDPSFAPTSTTVFMAQPPIEKFAPPDAEAAEFFAADLSEAEQRRLSASRAVAVFELVGPGRRAFDDYHAALELARELTQKLGGIFWDDETRTAVSLTTLNRRLTAWPGGAPFVNEHVTLHQYRDGELFRIVSLGMIKFGLPDVAVNHVAGAEGMRMSSLVNLTLQALLEGATPDGAQSLRLAIDDVHHEKMKRFLALQATDNAQRKVAISLVRSAPQAGDSENRLLEIAFGDDPAHRQERQSSALASLLGDKDAVIMLKHDDALLAASERARKRAFTLRERFAKAPPFGEQLLVKAPFQTPTGDDEWIWVEVVRWQADTIDGVLTEDAFDVPGLKGGARVEVQADRIFDYLWVKRDGSREGNDTQPLLDARARARREKP